MDMHLFMDWSLIIETLTLGRKHMSLKWVLIGLGNMLPHVQRHVIIWINPDSLHIGLLDTNIS